MPEQPTTLKRPTAVSASQHNKPVERIREGAVTISIFKNDGKHGPFHTAQILRSYLHKQMGEWVDTSSGYSVPDLENLIRAAVRARAEIELANEIEAERFREFEHARLASSTEHTTGE